MYIGRGAVVLDVQLVQDTGLEDGPGYELVGADDEDGLRANDAPVRHRLAKPDMGLMLSQVEDVLALSAPAVHEAGYLGAGRDAGQLFPDHREQVGGVAGLVLAKDRAQMKQIFEGWVETGYRPPFTSALA